MQIKKECAKRSRKDFYYCCAPNSKDLSKHIRGDTWYDCLTPQVYICKLRKGCKRWAIHKRFGK